ncbi:hypothetical protein PCI56_03295 [Plesiomonas shigelloides subsp. oncorhynchi]|nr:hypothetical protein [Plesiomonas shigelloides]
MPKPPAIVANDRGFQRDLLENIDKGDFPRWTLYADQAEAKSR